MSQAPNAKTMTTGEAGLMLVFAVTAFLCLFAAAKALDTAFAFHASLSAAASLAAVIAILNRYYDRPASLPPQEINGRPNYNMGPIKFAAVMSVIWGIAGFAVGLLIASQLAWPALNFDLPWTSFGRLRPLHTSAVIFAFGGNVLIATSFYVVQKTCRARLAGDLAPWFVVARLQFLHPDRRHRLSARRDPVQGICRTGMVRRSVADDRLGDVSAGLPGDAGQAQGTAHLRRQLVLPRLHRHHRRASSRQQSRAAGVGVRLEILHRLGRRAGCHVPVVVRPQRGRLLPDRRLPRHHVLLHSEARRAAGLFLPAVDHPFLGADLPLHLGRPASSALHGAAGLGADARHDVLDHAVDAVMGRHDQRPDDAVGRLGQASHRSRCCACWSCRSPSTACRPSKVR